MTKKNKIFIALAFVLLFCLVAVSCKSKAPTLESVKDELVSKIEKSAKVNEIFWGDGLPVVKIGSGEAMDMNLYNDQNDITVDDNGEWEYVHPQNSDYHSIIDIKILAQSVYSASFLEAVYKAQFEGLDSPAYSGKESPHYMENSYMLWQNTGKYENFRLIDKKRVYDYDTMKIDEKKSSDSRIYVTLDSRLEGEDTVLNVTLTFDRQSDGWYLSSPTY